VKRGDCRTLDTLRRVAGPHYLRGRPSLPSPDTADWEGSRPRHIRFETVHRRRRQRIPGGRDAQLLVYEPGYNCVFARDITELSAPRKRGGELTGAGNAARSSGMSSVPDSGPVHAGHQRVAGYGAIAVARSAAGTRGGLESPPSADVGKVSCRWKSLHPRQVLAAAADARRGHVGRGYEILRPIFLRAVAEITLQHHERLDGPATGPLEGEQIMLERGSWPWPTRSSDDHPSALSGSARGEHRTSGVAVGRGTLFDALWSMPARAGARRRDNPRSEPICGLSAS